MGRGAGSVAVLWGVAGLLSMFAPTTLHAQTGLTRDEVLRLPAQLRAAASDYGSVRCDATPVVGLQPGETLIATVLSVEPQGITVLPEGDFARLASALPQAPVSREGLARLAAAIECRYRELGYVFARATVLADPSGEEGRYRVSITEGVVRRVEALAESESLARLALRAFAGLREGVPLRAADVRRGLAHAASVGLTDLRPTIRRSRLDPSGLDVVLIVSSNADQLFTQAQNGNSKALGPVGLLAGAQIAGLTPLEERTTLGAYVATDIREQWSLQFDSEALIGGAGLKGRFGGAYSRARPGATLAPLEIDAKTLYLVGELSAPLLVRRGLVTYWRAGVESVDQKTSYLGGLPLGNDRLRVGYAGLRADGLFSSGGVWLTDVQVRRGLGALGASRRGATDLSRFDANPRGLVVRADGEFGTALSRNVTLRGTLRSQWTRDPLMAFERISFGGMNSGQGFDPGALVGDSGVSATVQLFFAPLSVGSLGSVRPFAQVSAAKLWTTDDLGLASARGASLGLGVQWALGRSWQVEASVAEPFGRIEGVGEDAYGRRFLLKITGSFEWRGRRPLADEAPK
jgi:hemolysin activation/secretion protein